MWAPFPIPIGDKWLDHLQERERPVYTHEEYINLVLHSGHIMSHDQTQQTTTEDPRMMAFFDSLVQRELEGWSSDESLESNNEVLEREAPLSASSSSQSDDEFDSYSPFTLRFASSILANVQSSEDNEDSELNHINAIVSELRSSDHTVQHENPNNNITMNENDGLAIIQPELSQHVPANAQTLMPGQQPMTARHKISDLISQKRKEYLTNARKATLEARRKSRTTTRQTQGQLSSSDEDSNEQPPIKTARTMPDVNNGASTSQVNDIIKNATKSTNQWLRDIKQRLKQEDDGKEQETLNTCHVEVGSTNGTTTEVCKPDPNQGCTAANKAGLGPHLSKDVPSTSTSTSSDTHPSFELTPRPELSADSTDQRTTWAEFSKFKHRVERARRQYRHSRDTQSSGSDHK